jgi:hypothetical protein
VERVGRGRLARHVSRRVGDPVGDRWRVGDPIDRRRRRRRRIADPRRGPLPAPVLLEAQAGAALQQRQRRPVQLLQGHPRLGRFDLGAQHGVHVVDRLFLEVDRLR